MYSSSQCLEAVIQAKNELENLVATERENWTQAVDSRISELVAETKIWESRFKASEATEFLSKSQGRKTDPNDAVKKHPYGSAGRVSGNSEIVDYFSAVRAKAITERLGGKLDPRHDRAIKIFNAPSTWGSEGVPADGGFAVPPDFREAIEAKLNGEYSILSLVNQLPTGSNEITLPKDEVAPWDNSSGVRVYWTAEAAQLTESKPLLESLTLKLGKATALIPVTEELLEDAPSISNYLYRAVPEKFVSEFNRLFLAGDGAPESILGIKNSNCTVSAAKDSGQTADTITYSNIVNMWSRLYAPCASTAVWHINQDVLPQLMQMTLEGTSQSIPVYLPPGGASASPYATLMGRPVIPVEGCSTLGDKGDIYLADWSRYICGVKSGGMRIDTSIHLYFDYDMTAFRFVMRIGGQPLWKSSVTPASASGNTLSCFVTLDERG